MTSPLHQQLPHHMPLPHGLSHGGYEVLPVHHELGDNDVFHGSIEATDLRVEIADPVKVRCDFLGICDSTDDDIRHIDRLDELELRHDALASLMGMSIGRESLSDVNAFVQMPKWQNLAVDGGC